MKKVPRSTGQVANKSKRQIFNFTIDNEVAEFLNSELLAAKSQPLRRDAVRVPARAVYIYAGCFIVIFTVAYK